jgi:NMD protein affecting ribosome stability and mRNA decay
MFCIKCGKPAVANNFCKEHFLEKERLFEKVPHFSVKICPSCGKGLNLREEFEKRVKTRNRITSCSFTEKTVGTMLHVTVTCEGYIKPIKSKTSHTEKFDVLLKKLKCDNCIKLSGGYYEAAFQVRGEHQERIMKNIEKLLPDELLTNIIKLKEGFDVRIVDKKVAFKIAGVLRVKFEVKESYKLVGEKKGTKLYRNFYSVR